MSPLAWDLGHIAAYEDLWLVHRAGGRELLRPDLLEVYDAFETPRAERDEHLNYLRREEARAYEREVRERSLAVLGELETDSEDPVLPDALVSALVPPHAPQPQETMLQAPQLAEPGSYHAPRLIRPPRAVGTG